MHNLSKKYFIAPISAVGLLLNALNLNLQLLEDLDSGSQIKNKQHALPGNLEISRCTTIVARGTANTPYLSGNLNLDGFSG